MDYLYVKGYKIYFKEVYLKVNKLVDSGLSSRKTVVKYLKALEEIGVLQSEKVKK